MIFFKRTNALLLYCAFSNPVDLVEVVVADLVEEVAVEGVVEIDPTLLRKAQGKRPNLLMTSRVASLADT